MRRYFIRQGRRVSTTNVREWAIQQMVEWAEQATPGAPLTVHGEPEDGGDPVFLLSRFVPFSQNKVEQATRSLDTAETPEDFEVSQHGSVACVYLHTDAAKAWVEENVQDPMYFGIALVVEPRYLDNLIAGMTMDGLVGDY